MDLMAKKTLWKKMLDRDLEDMAVETIQNEIQREKEFLKKKQRGSEL